MKSSVKYAIAGLMMSVSCVASATWCDEIVGLAVSIQEAKASGVEKSALYDVVNRNFTDARDRAAHYGLVDYIYNGGDPSAIYKTCVGSDKAV